MTDTDERFEARFERRLRAFADVPVAAVDPDEVAARVVRPRRVPSDLRIALLAAALLIAFVIAALALAGGPKPMPLVVLPSSVATAFTGDLQDALAGTWLADVPADMRFAGEGPLQRMALVIDPRSNQYSFLQAGAAGLERFAATLEWPGPDSVRFVTRGVSDGIEVAGSPITGCSARDAGTYRVQHSTDGLRLTLTAVDDACAARAAINARTWTRSMAAHSRGGFGVVDAFDPLFTLELPEGVYTASRTNDWQVIDDQVHGEEFMAVKDPQGFLDPCDISRGRYEVEPGAQAWVDYFAQLDGFTVDSVTDLRVDGHRAKQLVVHVDVDQSCPSGHLSEWQPKNETTDFHSFLRPGDTDYMVVVELADATLLFQVLPTPDALGGQVIGSIRFLEALPSTP
jgi:hypothetical protein